MPRYTKLTMTHKNSGATKTFAELSEGDFFLDDSNDLCVKTRGSLEETSFNVFCFGETYAMFFPGDYKVTPIPKVEIRY